MRFSLAFPLLRIEIEIGRRLPLLRAPRMQKGAVIRREILNNLRRRMGFRQDRQPGEST